ncbi:MAG: class I SAM-dependent methyltransferase [Candidatus Melainabacteria bacterium]|nr:class I SAM-dependent methyltransferase [Candidatus Melainabacteria bacterium]
MNYDEVINYYSARVSELSAKYESKTFEEIHGDWLGLLPAPPASVLDIGSGTGRDAAALALRGYDVVAVEPADSMIAASKQLHSDKTINWLQDRLPDLKKTMHLGSAFDVILLSAVWMHVAPNDHVGSATRTTRSTR